nr:helix-turn-helix transcriptional regulator [Phenylobacterium aquaticum]
MRSFQRRLSREGVAFSDLLDAARLEMAKRLMRHSDVPLTEIAMAIGFAEPAVFSRFFRRATGQTPSAWRAAV